MDAYLDRLGAARTASMRRKIEAQAEALRLLQDKRTVRFADDDGVVRAGRVFFGGVWWVPEEKLVDAARRWAKASQASERVRKAYWTQNHAVQRAVQSVPYRFRRGRSPEVGDLAVVTRELAKENDMLRAALKNCMDVES